MRPKIVIGIKNEQDKSGDPDFYEVSGLDWVKQLENQYPIIRAELDSLLSTAAIQPNFEEKLYYPPMGWKTFTFLDYKVWNKKNCLPYPKTIAALKKIPGLVGAGVSLMEANTEIKPHIGNVNALMRCHLGIEIPGVLPDCGMRVGNSERSWKEGSVLAFYDIRLHSAWNRTEKRRAVLIFDMLKPEFTGREHEICARVLAEFTLNKLKYRIGKIISGKKNKLVSPAIDAVYDKSILPNGMNWIPDLVTFIFTCYWRLILIIKG